MEIRVFTGKRGEILTKLYFGGCRVSDLARNLSMSKSSVSQYVNELSKIGLVEKNQKVELTNVGRILVEQIRLLELNYRSLSREAEFWNNHDLGSIPENMQHRLFELNNYEIVRSEEGEVMGYIRTFCSELSNAHFVKIVSSVVYPEWVHTISRICMEADTSVILSDDAFNMLSRNYILQLGTILNRAEILTLNNLRLLCTVTDSALCLGLYQKNGEFDVKCGLISYEESAVKWGLDLFRTLRSKSIPADQLKSEHLSFL